MKILVIDDNADNLRAATRMLKDHEVRLASSYEEVEPLLTRGDWNDGDMEIDEFYPDVILTDLFMPAPKVRQNMHLFVEQEMPVGSFIILLALKQGIKKIGLITDTNHHAHPASAMLDPIGGYSGQPFNVGDVTVLTASNLMGYVDENTYEEVQDNPEHEKQYPYSDDFKSRKGAKRVKLWDAALKLLMA